MGRSRGARGMEFYESFTPAMTFFKKMFGGVIIFDVGGAPGETCHKLISIGFSTGSEQMARWGDRGALAAWDFMKVLRPR